MGPACWHSGLLAQGALCSNWGERPYGPLVFPVWRFLVFLTYLHYYIDNSPGGQGLGDLAEPMEEGSLA